MLISILGYPYNQMQFYSAHGINDLGSYSRCQQDLGHAADYAVLNFNFSHLPLVLHFGLCLPRECDQQHVDILNRDITNLVNSAYISLAKSVDIETDYTKNWTRFQVNILKTDEDLEVWRSDTQTGFIIIMILTSCFLLFFCMIPTVFHTWKKVSSDSGSKQIRVLNQNPNDSNVEGNNGNNINGTIANMSYEKTKATYLNAQSSQDLLL